MIFAQTTQLEQEIDNYEALAAQLVGREIRQVGNMKIGRRTTVMIIVMKRKKYFHLKILLK